MALINEIFAQPSILSQLLDEQMKSIQKTGQELSKQDFNYIFLAARGTSDNAGRYAQYLWGSYNHYPVAMAAPSLFSLYKQPPSLNGALVIAISQSGQSPDILSVLEEAKKQGRPTVAITNAVQSPLANQADFVIDIGAGEEKAIAATKTYTAQLLIVAMLSLALGGSRNDAHIRNEDLQKTPKWIEQALMLNEQIERTAQRYRYMEQCVILGRGYNYATAFEWALKLKELCYIEAEPYSSADFFHGPVAIVERGYPVFAIAPSGETFSDLLRLITYLRHEMRAEVMAISDNPRVLELADIPIPTPSGIPEWLSPIVSIIPAQIFSYHLTHIKGYDTEAPRGLKKITLTQ